MIGWTHQAVMPRGQTVAGRRQLGSLQFVELAVLIKAANNLVGSEGHEGGNRERHMNDGSESAAQLAAVHVHQVLGVELTSGREDVIARTSGDGDRCLHGEIEK